MAEIRSRQRREPNLRDVKETVLVLVLLVDAAHQRSGRRQNLIDEDEDGLLWAQLDALPNHIDELANCEIRGDEILLLIDRRDVGLFNLLADDGDTVGVLGADALGLCLTLLKGLLKNELAMSDHGALVGADVRARP